MSATLRLCNTKVSYLWRKVQSSAQAQSAGQHQLVLCRCVSTVDNMLLQREMLQGLDAQKPGALPCRIDALIWPKICVP